MKRFLKIVGIGVGVLLVLVIGFAVFIQVKGIPTYDPPQIPDLKVEATPERIANGLRIATIQCILCHADDDGNLTGNQLKDVPAEFGTIYSKNITHDSETGIGTWTDGQLYYFLRTGVRADGSYAPPYMPKYPLLADEDLKDIIAWLRSDSEGLEASKEEAPPAQPSFLTKFLSNVVFKPLPFPAAPISRPDTTDLLKWGEYTANGLIGCFGCHSADFKTINELNPPLTAGYYGGGNPMLNMEGAIVPSSNITFDETGIAKYSEEDFVTVMSTGKKLDGSAVRYPMMPMPTLTASECRAIYAFLKTVPKIKNEVKR